CLRAVATYRGRARRRAAPVRRPDRRAVEHRAARQVGHGNRAVSVAFWSAADTVRRVAAGEVTAAQIVDTLLERIAEIDGQLGASRAGGATGAGRPAADMARGRAAGQPLGPLAGVTVALKDVLVTRGLATTAGSKILQGWIPPYDACVVERLRAADAIVIGKV